MFTVLPIPVNLLSPALQQGFSVILISDDYKRSARDTRVLPITGAGGCKSQ